MADLESRPLFELVVRFHDVDARRVVGEWAAGERIVAPAAGGTFEGEHLRGEVLEPWPDYLIHRRDGVTDHDIRAVLRTDDGALIYLRYEGIGHREGLGPLGEDRPFYFRCFARFETGAERYAWLNRILAVMVAHPVDGSGLGWSVHAIL